MRLHRPAITHLFVPMEHEGTRTYVCLYTTAVSPNFEVKAEYLEELENQFVDFYELNMLGSYIGHMLVPKRGRVRNLYSHLAITAGRFDRLPLKDRATQGGDFSLMFRLEHLRVYSYGPDGLFVALPQDNKITAILE